MTVHDHAWWLVSRAAGTVGLLAMTLSVVLGLALATRTAGLQAKRFAGLHEQLSLISLVAIAVHGEALLGDRFLHPGPLDIAVPFVIDFRPAAVAAGIVGGWLAAFLALSFYARKRFGAKRWRQLHRFTTVAWALAVVHTLAAGTDERLLRIPVLGSVGVVAALLSVRLLGTRSGSRRSSTPSRTASARSPG
jgi:sulfoxide reductase heme-binding subunit YedZ